MYKDSLLAILKGMTVGIILAFAITGVRYTWIHYRGGGYSDIRPLKILNLRIEKTKSGLSAAGMVDGRAVVAPADKIVVSYDVSELFALRPLSDTSDGKNSRSPSGRQEPRIHIRQDLAVKDSKGNALILKPAIIDIEKPLKEKPAKFINEIYLSAVKNLAPGDYVIEVLVTDLVGFQTAKGVVGFMVKGG